MSRTTHRPWFRVSRTTPMLNKTLVDTVPKVALHSRKPLIKPRKGLWFFSTFRWLTPPPFTPFNRETPNLYKDPAPISKYFTSSEGNPETQGSPVPSRSTTGQLPARPKTLPYPHSTQSDTPMIVVPWVLLPSVSPPVTLPSSWLHGLQSENPLHLPTTINTNPRTRTFLNSHAIRLRSHNEMFPSFRVPTTFSRKFPGEGG